jgi:argininosuccinate lyase
MAFFHKTRTGSDPDPLLQHYYVEALNRRDFFEAMHWYDVAHVVALKESGLVTQAVARALLGGFREMEREGVFEARSRLRLGGVHSGENYLQEKLGEQVSGWIHIGRSSPTNRSVASRIVTRSILLDQMEELSALQEAMVERAEEYAGAVMPGYAYLHSSEPWTFGYYLLSFVYALQRSREAFETAYRHTNESASAAEVGSGSYFPVDLDLEARLVGFDRMAAHARDSIRNFDYLLMAFWAETLAGNVVGRLAQDLRVLSTKEFNLLTLGPEYSISSSVAVQTRIPYSPGIVAATGGGLLMGRLTGALSMCKTTSDEPFVGTELLRDLWSTADEFRDTFRIMTGTIRSLTANRERMNLLSSQQGDQATAFIALVMRHAEISYRAAHQVVGQALNRLEARGLDILGLRAEDLDAAIQDRTGVSVHLPQEEVERTLDVAHCVGLKATPGSTSPKEVRRMLEECRGLLSEDARGIQRRRDQLAAGRREMEERVAGILDEGS